MVLLLKNQSCRCILLIHHLQRMRFCQSEVPETLCRQEDKRKPPSVLPAGGSTEADSIGLKSLGAGKGEGRNVISASGMETSCSAPASADLIWLPGGAAVSDIFGKSSALC
mmetsp:Transcript_95383/g.179379  ORF Transcript_95383/g.179379 Transcript_95383/m.179379 type:complete len:111 (+) Transcript_95383:198-530(+)